MGLDLTQANDSAGDAGAGVASGLAEFVATHTEIIGISVHHQCAPNDVQVSLETKMKDYTH